SIIGALIGWIIWAVLAWDIGTKLLPEPQTDADVGQTLRTLGFAASPGLLRILGFIPLLGWIIVIIANIWMLVAMVVAVRQALDYKSTGRAVGVCAIGFIVEIIILVLVYSLVGPAVVPA
ncbi:MAG: YIP1 family protein, partial [Nitrosospira sp.]|nr:YIP1 family protein [Nitrosospira sp.]